MLFEKFLRMCDDQFMSNIMNTIGGTYIYRNINYIYIIFIVLPRDINYVDHLFLYICFGTSISSEI